MSPEIISLSQTEIVPDRPFTHPEHTQADIAALQRMRVRLHEVLTSSAPTADPPHPWRVSLHEANGRRHRVIILNRTILLEANELTFVGFCGQKYGHIDAESLHTMSALDAELVNELIDHPHMLSYSSMEVADGNWINLVLLRSAEGIEHWRTSERHIYAANELSPRYFASVRLHNGVLPNGLASVRMTLLRTKYYDFSESPAWRALREMTRLLKG
jgi:hypothetical protein